MKESIQKPARFGIALVLLAGSLSCSAERGDAAMQSNHNAPSAPATPVCDVIMPKTWGAVLPPLDPEAIAARLGYSVTADDIRVRGLMGWASCTPGLTIEAVNAGTGIVGVSGVSDECIAIGLQSDQEPKPGVPYSTVLAVCANVPLPV